MSDQEPAALVSEDEIERALAEAEGEGGIPNLDDGQAPRVVAVPVTADPVQPVATAQTPETFEKQYVAVVGSPDSAAAAELLDDAAGTAAPGRVGFLGVVYAAIDRTLWAVNLPFTRLSAEARQWVGALALVTLVMALVALYVLPIAVPNRTLAGDLRRSAARTTASPAVEIAPP